MLELVHKLIKTCKLATKWLKPIIKDLNELIGLNEYDYYSKVLKTIIIRSTKYHFLVVIRGPMPMCQNQSEENP